MYAAQVLVGDVAGAKAAAAKITRRLGDECLKFEAQNGIVEGQARIGDMAGAKATAAEINDKRMRASAYCEIASVQAGRGRGGGQGHGDAD